MSATYEVEINPIEARKGKIYLWIAIFIFGAAASVVAKLVQIGAGAPIDGRNPISFCNLLFVGNVVAGLTLLIYSYKEWRPSELIKLSRKQWVVQFVLAATSGAIAPSLMFLAVERTSVTNIVLMETIEIPLGLFFAWMIYREKSSWGAVIGAVLALVGVATTLALQTDMPTELMQQGRMRGGIGQALWY